MRNPPHLCDASKLEFDQVWPASLTDIKVSNYLRTVRGYSQADGPFWSDIALVRDVVSVK